MRKTTFAVLAMFGTLGCDHGATETVGEVAQAILSDGAHGGNPGFDWLPPIAQSQPALQGGFASRLAPTVEIDALDPVTKAQKSIVATYTNAGGPFGGKVAVDGNHYAVNWNTAPFKLDPSLVYRIRVLLGGRVLGIADVVLNQAHVDGTQYVSLTNGSTLPIKFFLNACAPVVCAADQCHTPGACSPCSGTCLPATALPNGAPCSDGNACTRGDTCQAGACVSGTPVTCVASGACHLAGTCDPASGVCSNPAAPNGAPCNDGNACTQSDTCQSGACVGAAPVTCTAKDACHVAGACDPASGVCSNPPALNGTACTDGNACTQSDTCQAGACVGASPIVCAASDQCHAAGTCDPGSGACSNPALPDGAGCSDGNACTRSDTCLGGACMGANPVQCAAPDQCHVPGACDPSTGICSNPAVPDGTACSDGNACTLTDTCQAGACRSGTPLSCDDSNPCTADSCGVAGCVHTPIADGAACASACLQNGGGVCQAGTCSGVAISCEDHNSCTADSCDPAHGCAHAPLADGAACAAACLQPGTGSCKAGACAGTPVADGATCDDFNACTAADACLAGLCAGTAISCDDHSPCTSDSCDSASGCSHTALADGTACIQDNACRQGATCAAGACGTALPDGTACSDASVCTVGDQCLIGTCVSGALMSCDDVNPCTTDGCDPVAGCTHQAINACVPPSLYFYKLAPHQVNAYGGGFAPSEPVSIYLDGVLRATLTADGAGNIGNFSALVPVFTLPADFPPSNSYLGRAVGTQSGRVAERYLIWQYTGGTTINPTQALPGAVITVSAGDLFANESVSIHLDDPMLGYDLPIALATASPNGGFTTTFILPYVLPDTQWHSWEVSVIGPVSGKSSRYLEVLPSPLPLGITPGSGTNGTVVTVSGATFGANESVQIQFGGALVATTTASANGVISTTFSVPLGLAPGTYTVSATGQTSNIVQFASSFKLTSSAKCRFSADPVLPGGAETATCTGFVANATVSINLLSPGGIPIVLGIATATADANGGAILSFAFPDVPGGQSYLLEGASQAFRADSLVFVDGIEVTPSRGAPGTIITIHGGGYTPGSVVGLYFGGVFQGPITTDGHGRYATTLTEPLFPGSPTAIVARQNGAADQTAPFAVVYSPTLTVSPSTLSIGSPAQITFDQFAPNDHVFLYVQGGLFTSGYMDMSGHWTFGTIIPFLQSEKGQFVQITATGDYSNATASTTVYLNP